jgi:hypothetical protein
MKFTNFVIYQFKWIKYRINESRVFKKSDILKTGLQAYFSTDDDAADMAFCSSFDNVISVVAI